jgi:hypothetical protein
MSTTYLVAIWSNYGNMWQVFGRETRKKSHHSGRIHHTVFIYLLTFKNGETYVYA